MSADILEKSAPIFKKFSLNKLHGYKDISITINSPIRIASADNGTGKTSLLNALYAVFAGQAAILFGIDFESIEIIWADDSTSSYQKTELFGGLETADLETLAENNYFAQWASRSTKDDIVELLKKFVLGDLDEATQTNTFTQIYRESPFDRQEILDSLSSITSPLIQTGAFNLLHAKAKDMLGDVAVLYLPTYRRIEADIPEFRYRSSEAVPTSRSRNRQQRDSWDSTRLIYFGMADVEAKLNSIITQIRKETLEAYSRNNGRTLEQLIGSDIPLPEDRTQNFDLSSIEVVLARVGKDSKDLRTRLSEIIKSNEIYAENRRELRKFLTQLLQVYAERRDDELAIERFVNVVNGYLCPPEDTTTPGSISEKKLIFDKLKLELVVKNLITGRDIKFGNLSSGEKQVVSIFARLMLDPRRRYLILVDEPELSLSIEWQQRLLPDISSATNCHQLLAITHSPFIFDNELSLVAGGIDMRLHEKGVGN